MPEKRSTKTQSPEAVNHSSAGAQNLIEVSAGLLFRAGKLLITQRLTNSHLGGLWEFPGGKREPNETFEQCLQRELREELGIEVEVTDLIEDCTHHYPERWVHLKFYRCSLLRNEPRPILCSDLAWITPQQFAAYKFPDADARLLEKLRKNPQWWT
jgi:mutator protein MutT